MSFGRSWSCALAGVPLLAVLAILAPYFWPLDRAPTSPLSDIEHYHAPMAQLFADGLRRDGELPRWNVHDFAGVPTIGDPQSERYNPLHWPLFLWPGLHGFGLLIAGYALAGAAGFFVYARSLGLTAAGAAAGATAFALGGKLLMHLVVAGHIVFAPAFLIPLALWTLERTAGRPSPAAIAAGALFVGLFVVSLHPQLLLYTGLLVSVVCAVSAWHARSRARALAALAASAALGLALSAVQWVPVLAFAPEFTRSQPALFDSALAGTSTQEPGAALGPPHDWAAQMLSARAASIDLRPEGHYFLGGAALMLVLVALFAAHRDRAQRRPFWLHAAIACAVLAIGLGARSGLDAWLRLVPGLGFFRIPARAWVLLGLPIAVLIGLGTDALVRRTAGIGAASAAFVLAGAALVASGAPAPHLLAFGIAASGVALLAFSPRAGAMAIAAALAVDAALVVAPHVETAPQAAIGRLPDGIALPADLAETVRFAELDPYGWAPVVPELEVRRRGLERLAGYNPLIPWRFALYLAAAGGFDPFHQRYDVAVPLPRRAEPALLDLLGVSYLLVPPDTDGGEGRWLRSETAFPRAYLVPGPLLVPEGERETLIPREQEALVRLAHLDPRAAVLLHGRAAASAIAALGADPKAPFEPYRPVALAHRGANRLALDVALERPGVLVLNEAWFPGWRASDGGREIPVLRANVLFRALVLPPGDHHLALEFAPGASAVAFWVSAAAAIATLGLAASALGSVFTRNRTGDPSCRT